MRRRGEDGIALPVAVIVLSIVMLVTAVSLISATNSSRRTNQDLEEKLALQAANSGLDLARDRLNPSKLTGVLTPALPCVGLQDAVGPTVTKLVPSVVDGVLPGWCPGVTERYNNGATSLYRVSSSGLVGGLLGVTGPRTIVSTGTYANTTRKVAITVEPTTTTQSYFGSYGITSNKDVDLSTGTAITTAVRSNGRVKVGQLDLCGGPVTSGPGTTPVSDFSNGGTYCGKPASQAAAGTITAATSRFALPAVDAAAAMSSNNDLNLCGIPPLYLAASIIAAAPGKCSGYPGRRPTIDFDDNRSYTIPSGDYYFCSWSMTGASGSIVIPKGATVRVFIGSPEDCNAMGTTQFVRGSNYVVDNRNKDPASFQVHVAGSASSTADGVTIGSPRDLSRSGATDDYMTIYAPSSNVVLSGAQRLYGAVVGDQVTATGGGFISPTTSTQALGTAGSASLLQSKFRECVTSSGTAPDAGCAVS